jgi:hypothetical protein
MSSLQNLWVTTVVDVVTSPSHTYYNDCRLGFGCHMFHEIPYRGEMLNVRYVAPLLFYENYLYSTHFTSSLNCSPWFLVNLTVVSST